MSTPGTRPELTASIALVCGGALWGFYWVPLRALEQTGLPGAWAGLVVYGGSCIILAVLIGARVIRITSFGPQLILGGLMTGAAVSLYSTSIAFTDVIRAILLFYLTPIWGTILGLMFLGERLTIYRVGALALAATGLLIVLGGGDAIPLPRNLGDWLALLAGLSWAFGTLFVYRLKSATPMEQVSAFAFGGLVITALTLLIAPGAVATGATLMDAAGKLPWGFLVALYFLPMLFLTIWPARLLTPGRVGILLMSDVIVGVGSAALFANEVFGWREAIGSTLIISAAVLDVAAPRTPAKTR